MNNLYILIILIFTFSNYTNAQSITPSVLGSGGNYYSVGGTSISFTIGEVATTTLSNSNNKITQGFQQPSYTATSISEVENPVFDLTVFPNPASEIIYIVNNGNNFSSNAQLYLVDVLGRKLMEQKLENKYTSINLQQLSAGTYFILIEENGFNSFTHKITKVQ